MQTLVELMVSLCVLAIVLVGGCKICARAGYPAILGAVFLLPFLNFALWVYLAFAKWPIQKELEKTRGLLMSKGRGA